MLTRWRPGLKPGPFNVSTTRAPAHFPPLSGNDTLHAGGAAEAAPFNVSTMRAPAHFAAWPRQQ